GHEEETSEVTVRSHGARPLPVEARVVDGRELRCPANLVDAANVEQRPGAVENLLARCGRRRRDDEEPELGPWASVSSCHCDLPTATAQLSRRTADGPGADPFSPTYRTFREEPCGDCRRSAAAGGETWRRAAGGKKLTRASVANSTSQAWSWDAQPAARPQRLRSLRKGRKASELVDGDRGERPCGRHPAHRVFTGERASTRPGAQDRPYRARHRPLRVRCERARHLSRRVPRLPPGRFSPAALGDARTVCDAFLRWARPDAAVRRRRRRSRTRASHRQSAAAAPDIGARGGHRVGDTVARAVPAPDGVRGEAPRWRLPAGDGASA